MAEFRTEDGVASMTSPGGFQFGVIGWNWAAPVPRSITFFLDNTVAMHDQYGRPIKGFVVDGMKEVWLVSCAPAENPPYQQRLRVVEGKKVPYATHAEVVAALAADHIDWTKLNCAGWPQLPYADLKKLAKLPPTPVDDLRYISSVALRKDALRMRREADEAVAREFQEAEAE